ncbi:MAG: tRNA lysidine(34) synthetase TilS [Armatimonadota bacterium]
MSELLNWRLLPDGASILVGLSGGADSLALLHALCAGREAHGWSVAAVHVHHGMRGEAAEADVRFLEQLCGDWSVPLTVVRVDVPALARARRISVEEAGRDARYAAFAEVAGSRGAERVATAHHADDQVETVLMNLLRGTGTDGLAGIPEERPLARGSAVRVVRPLLDRSRAELAAYCEAHGLQPRHDVTNDDLSYRRNRLRATVLPLLEAESPSLRSHLLQLSRQVREEQSALERLAAELRSASSVTTTGPGLVLDAGTLAQAPPALARRALRQLLEEATPGVEISAALLQRLWELVAAGEPSAVDLPGAPWRARRVRDQLRLEPAEPRRSPTPVLPRTLSLSGEVEAPELGIALRLEVGHPPDDPRRPPLEAVLDLQALRPPLCLRAPERGDRFRPLGAPGTRLLSDLFTDRKIPREERAAWPVLADEEGIVWVVGLAIADRSRVRPETRECLRVTARRLLGKMERVA